MQYAVTPGHSVLVSNKSKAQTAGEDRLLIGKNASEGGPTILPDGLMKEDEIKRKVEQGCIYPLGGVPYEPPKKLVMPRVDSDLDQGETPIQVIDQSDGNPKITKVMPATATVPSKWVLDPDKIKDKPVEELVAMIVDRTDEEDVVEEAKKFSQEEAVAFLSQDFARLPEGVKA